MYKNIINFDILILAIERKKLTLFIIAWITHDYKLNSGVF